LLTWPAAAYPSPTTSFALRYWRTAYWRTALIFAVALSAATIVRAETVQGDLRIFVLNVGQGDAILIVCPHGTHRLLIDSGASNYTSSQAAFKALLAAILGSDDRINVVVASHPHADHVAGLHFVLSTYRVKKFIDNGKPYTTSFKKIRTLANSLSDQGKLAYFQANKFPPPSVADFCPASNVKAQLLVPNGFGEDSNVNNNSVVLLVRYNDLKFLFTGDAEEEEEALLLDDPVVASRMAGAQFYKIGHHGAETSSTDRLVAAVGPRVVAVSSGCKGVSPNTGYRHPRAAVINRLQAVMGPNPDRASALTIDAGQPQKGKWTTVVLHEQLFATSGDGTIQFVSDGSSISQVSATFTSPLGTCQ
jgi:beta-lactamase superfamily II metal-dependent hydrolase